MIPFFKIAVTDIKLKKPKRRKIGTKRKQIPWYSTSRVVKLLRADFQLLKNPRNIYIALKCALIWTCLIFKCSFNPNQNTFLQTVSNLCVSGCFQQKPELSVQNLIWAVCLHTFGTFIRAFNLCLWAFWLHLRMSSLWQDLFLPLPLPFHSLFLFGRVAASLQIAAPKPIWMIVFTFVKQSKS